MKVLCLGGPYDGRRLDTNNALAHLEVPASSPQGPVKHVYKLHRIPFGNAIAFNFYIHSNLTLERAMEALVERYPRSQT